MITRINNYLVNVKGLTPEEAKTVICQSAHETNFWRSSVFQHSNNLFGIKAHKRKIKNKLEIDHKGYATYLTIEASCDDLIDLVRRRYDPEAFGNIHSYALSLKEKGYFEDSLTNYVKGMLNAYKVLFPESYHKYNKP